MKFRALLTGAVGLLLAGVAPPALAGQTVLTVYAAGTLAPPFRQLDKVFEKRHPGVVVQPEFGGSVMLAKRITELHHRADVFASADYHVIPDYFFPESGRKGFASWYVGFVGNAITFAYTPKSRFAGQITPSNWYKVLARPGVQIGRSNPNTDPSGYQTLQMLSLAQKFYHAPGLKAKVLANAPPTNMRDTETALLSALQLDQIDYLAIYRSDAVQLGLKYLPLPARIDLSDPKDAAIYKTVTAQTKNGKLPGSPIVYAVTIPANAQQKTLAAQYVALLLGPKGRAIMAKNGFNVIDPAYGMDIAKMPVKLRPLVKPWPAW
ncbi:extracellular solute-binding protein [Acidiphilium sp. AL]|uniref:extracellular solute-binding protein n=1 Tax=Acidiphilium sp. AL TaxID=2871704 RepID=UPI0021CAEB22|nr:extracellular solute-binding protein [Acidiphilium sp. AL]MCU4160334.1 extracellular solute-binding protein [Acidiphilium sp. AL]